MIGAIEPRLNFRKLAPSRRRLHPGDVFAMLMPDDLYLFGRIVTTNAAGPMGKGIVIYVFRVRSATLAPPPRAELVPDRLLLPPQFVNRYPWSQGYFTTVEHRPLLPGEVLPVHCFHDVIRDRYVDENRAPLPGPVEPVGRFLLNSVRTLDDAVSEALGIPLAP
ncbi:Imm26 family immunity protein [Amycolatopsis sp. 3B14]|uniref:Imm26 family immunity protein n=1 Tax=Amycolatopsis sp. 3B14 TaxID=3243600 RepID=UPI003D9551D2